MIDSPDPFPDFQIDLGALDGGGVKLLELTPRHAEHQWVRTVHSEEHIRHVHHVCEIGGGILDQGDTPVGRDSCDVALLSLGSLLTCCDAVADGTARRAFSAGRPPGHHAEPDRAMGFCLFANVAIAARYLQQRHGVGRIAIVDFDVHHGNGTQASLEADPSVFFVSMHEDPKTCYPGSGFAWEIGVGAGRGSTFNVPFTAGATDEDYLLALREHVIPAVERFAPEVLLISAGFDAHHDDPLANIDLTEE